MNPQGTAIVYHRIGPYHHARLCATAAILELVAVQGCNQDRTYQWDKIVHGGQYPMVTLFECADCDDEPGRVVRDQVAAALDKLNPGSVVVPGWSSKLALACLQWCMRNATPAIVVSDSTAWDSKRSPFKEGVKKMLVRLFSAGLVAGRPHSDYLVSLGLPRERVVLGYDVVDNEHFDQTLTGVKTPIGTEKEVPEKYFLASARFVEKKNLARLIEAYAQYRTVASRPVTPVSQSRAKPWDLVLLGDGPLKPQLCGLITELNLRDCVRLPGFKQYHELPAFYGAASAFVHASTTDQWGLVVNEAMASGLPVLVSNRCGCAMDLVQAGGNGFTFDPYNVEQLAELMFRVAGPGFNLAAAGEASRKIISQWGLGRFVDGLTQAVRLALAAPRPQPTLFDRWLLRLLLWR